MWGCGGGGMRIANCEWSWQVSNIGHQTSAPSWASGSYHLLIKMSKLSQWHWLMTMATYEMMMLLMMMRSSPMYSTLAWGSRVACDMWHEAGYRMPMLNAFCQCYSNDKCLPLAGRWGVTGGRNNIQHAFTVWAISIFSSCSQAAIHLSISVEWESLLKPSSA